MPKSESLPSLFAPVLFFQEGWERFTLIVLYKRATVSYSLPSLFTKEQQEVFALFQERITISLFHSQKTSNSLEKPKSKFATLKKISWLSLKCTLFHLCSSLRLPEKSVRKSIIFPNISSPDSWYCPAADCLYVSNNAVYSSLLLDPNQHCMYKIHCKH